MKRLGDDVLSRLRKDPAFTTDEEIQSLLAEIRVWRNLLMGGQGHGSLNKLAVGALQQSIQAHGSVTPEWVGSAAKRVVNQIKAFVRGEVLREDI